MISFDNEMLNSIKDDIKGINDINALRDINNLVSNKIKQIGELAVLELKIGSVINCVRKGKSEGLFRLDKINKTRVRATKLNGSIDNNGNVIGDLSPRIFETYTIPFSLVVGTDLKVKEKPNSGKAPAKARNPLEQALDSAIARDGGK